MGRSTIEFNGAADTQLAYLADTLGVKSKAEVVRNALTLYTYLVQLLDEKPRRSLGIIDEDDENRIEKVILVPGMQPLVAARRAETDKVPATVGG